MNDKPFKVINCLSQGFAVAGPAVAGVRGAKIGDRNPDLEMVLWGVSFEKAWKMADDLNADPKLQHVKD
jgi:hypothetical protein